MWLVRIALPAAIFVAGVVLIVIGGDAPLGAGIVLIGVSGLVVLGNVMMQLGGQSERDRADEERRRQERHVPARLAGLRRRRLKRISFTPIGLRHAHPRSHRRVVILCCVMAVALCAIARSGDERLSVSDSPADLQVDFLTTSADPETTPAPASRGARLPMV